MQYPFSKKPEHFFCVRANSYIAVFCNVFKRSFNKCYINVEILIHAHTVTVTHIHTACTCLCVVVGVMHHTGLHVKELQIKKLPY